jgi:Trypsin-like peptidase domain
MSRRMRSRRPDQPSAAVTPGSLQHALNKLPLKINLDPLAARNTGLLALELLSPFTVMLAITEVENPRATDPLKNGTGSLIDTGQNKFLVTNHHVYDEFVKLRAENSFARLLMSGAGRPFVDISAVPCIASDEILDLAVLAIPPFVVSEQGKAYYRAAEWPPRRPNKGTKVVVAGYPGEGRCVLDGDTLGISPLSVGRTITSISDRQFLLVDETQDSYSHTPDGRSALTSFGGISGGAAFSQLGRGDRISDYYLCGFEKEEGFNNTIVVVHADFIKADGSIRDDGLPQIKGLPLE